MDDVALRCLPFDSFRCPLKVQVSSLLYLLLLLALNSEIRYALDHLPFFARFEKGALPLAV